MMGTLCATFLALAVAAPLAVAQAAPRERPLDAGARSSAPTAFVRNAAVGGPIERITFDRHTRNVISREATSISCERVHAAAGTVACLSYDRSLPGMSRLDLMDFALRMRFQNAVQPGSVISRARVSADGRYASTTVFVSGHNYVVPGFSTATQIWDTRTGRLAVALAHLVLMHQGKVMSYTPQTRLNYWGVTFDPLNVDRYFVTVSIAGRAYLAEGYISKGTVHTVRADVECPSFSPDGGRIAFKKRRPRGDGWDPAVLDLDSGKESVFVAAKGVDDQIEWLDDDTIVYEATETIMGGAKTDLMVRNVRAAGTPERLWLPNAASPAVLRANGP
jgi:hypothetical protein